MALTEETEVLLKLAEKKLTGARRRAGGSLITELGQAMDLIEKAMRLNGFDPGGH